jgi:hypothetical protein
VHGLGPTFSLRPSPYRVLTACLITPWDEATPLLRRQCPREKNRMYRWGGFLLAISGSKQLSLTGSGRIYLL